MAHRRGGFHDFCFINLMTPDLDPTAAFLASSSAGRTETACPAASSSWSADARRARSSISTRPGMPSDMRPVVGVMIKVADVDATAARVVELGGRAHPVRRPRQRAHRRSASIRRAPRSTSGSRSRRTAPSTTAMPTGTGLVRGDDDRRAERGHVLRAALRLDAERPARDARRRVHRLRLDGSPIAGAMTESSRT